MTRLGLLTWSHAVRIPYSTSYNDLQAVLLTGLDILSKSLANKAQRGELRRDLLAVFANHQMVAKPHLLMPRQTLIQRFR